jgi:hypothetical protein
MQKQAGLTFVLVGTLLVIAASSCRPDPTKVSRFLPDPEDGVSIRAFLFPGRTDHRALIISGIHGDEMAGSEVVERLRFLLKARSAAGNPPFFTTMLIPVLIKRTRLTEERYVPGGLGLVEGADGKSRQLKLVQQPIEPNHNFPLPGEDYEIARRRGARGPADAENDIRQRWSSGRLQERSPRGPLTSIRMLPETRFLLQVIERFQPERLAAIHAHSRASLCHPCEDGDEMKCGGEGPGIFVDPRGIDPISGKIHHPAEWKEDHRLAHRMVHEALKRLERRPLPSGRSGDTPFPPFAGNQSCPQITVLYFSPRYSEGNSLGDWAPVPTTARPGITTVTVELPKYRREDSRATQHVIDLHRDILADVFLDGR